MDKTVLGSSGEYVVAGSFSWTGRVHPDAATRVGAFDKAEREVLRYGS